MFGLFIYILMYYDVSVLANVEIKANIIIINDLRTILEFCAYIVSENSSNQNSQRNDSHTWK